MCILLLQPILAQQTWNSSDRPDIFQPRMAMFKAMPIGKKDIVFVGNSITFWGDWPELLKSARYKNRAIPGDTSYGLLELLAEGIIGNPKSIFIMIGINDLARGIPVDTIQNNYKRALALIRQHSTKTKIYFQSILPVNDNFGKLKNHYKRAAEIPAINNFLKEWTKQEGVGYVNLFDVMADADGKLKETYTWDGVHLMIEGYRQWVDELKRQKLIE